MSSALLPDPSEIEGTTPVPLGTEPADSVLASTAAAAFDIGSRPGKVTRHLVSGTSALGLGVVIERGTGFLANILAARFGGAATFGVILPGDHNREQHRNLRGSRHRVYRSALFREISVW